MQLVKTKQKYFYIAYECDIFEYFTGTVADFTHVFIN